MSDTNPIIAFCRARQMMRDEEHRTREDRTDRLEEKKQYLDELKQSMLRHNISIVHVPAPDVHGTTCTIKLVNKQTHYRQITQPDDVVKTMSNIDAFIDTTPTKDVTKKMVQVFSQRMQRPTDVRASAQDKRLIITKSEKTVEMESEKIHPETRGAADSLVETIHSYDECCKSVQQVRKQKRDAEKQALHFLSDDVSRVRMERNGITKIVQIQKVHKNKKRNKKLGYREACRCIKTAADETLMASGTDLFESNFLRRLQKIVEEAFAQQQITSAQSTTTLKVVERKLV